LHAAAPHPRHRARGDGPWEGVADRVRRQDPHAPRHARPGVPRAAARNPPDPRLFFSPTRRTRAWASRASSTSSTTRLYRAGDGHLLALKDAVEHNRRNVNGVYRVKATIHGARAVAHVQEMVGWGVETRLRDQVADTCARLGLSWERERIAQLEVIGGGTRLHFARKLGPWRRLAQLYHRAV